MTPQSIVTVKPCSGVSFDHNPNWHPGPTGQGWTGQAPRSGPLSCGDKYLDSIYCAAKSTCKGATWGTVTPDKMNSASVHWIVDVLQGGISVCAQQSGRFGVGSLACKPVACAAVGSMPTRCVLPIQVVGEAQPQGPPEVIFDALEDSTVIGAIGTAEPMS